MALDPSLLSVDFYAVLCYNRINHWNELLQMKSLGEFLRDNRKRLGFTQDAIAEKLNIVTPVLSKWENNKRIPDLATCCKLCNIYGISISDCINLENSENPILPPEEYNAVILGNTIKELRQKNGWTQGDMGRKLFVTSQTVSKWESGGVTSFELLQQLAELFAVSPEVLLFGLDSEPTPTAAPAKPPITKATNKRKTLISVIAVLLSLFIVFCAVLTAILLKSCDTQDNQGGSIQTPDGGDDIDSSTKDPDELPENDNKQDNSTFVLPLWNYLFCYDYSDEKPCLDMVAPVGTEVYSVAAGTVTSIAFYYDNVFAYYFIEELIIEHGDGILTSYRNIRDVSLSVGDTVEAGQIIGEVTNRNRCCGVHDDHLCFTMLIDGTPVDPRLYIPLEND